MIENLTKDRVLPVSIPTRVWDVCLLLIHLTSIVLILDSSLKQQFYAVQHSNYPQKLLSAAVVLHLEREPICTVPERRHKLATGYPPFSPTPMQKTRSRETNACSSVKPYPLNVPDLLSRIPDYHTVPGGEEGNWFLSGTFGSLTPSQLYLVSTKVTLSRLHVPTMMGAALTARSHAVTDPSTRIATCMSVVSEWTVCHPAIDQDPHLRVSLSIGWFCEETSQLGTASWSCCCVSCGLPGESWVHVDRVCTLGVM